jgi:hypothetical protein
MFPLILSSKARNKPSTSRVLALLPDLEANSSAIKNYFRMGNKYNKSISMRNFHRCLDIALQSYKVIQNNGGFNTYIRLGDDIQQRMVTVPLAFILGDAKSQDAICCRYGPHNTKRMCRACHVSFEDSDNVGHQCRWVQHHQFDEHLNIIMDSDMKYPKKEVQGAYNYMNDHSQHICRNAFYDIDFAGFPRGVFGCTPHDMMHCFLEGILKYTTRIFIQSFTEKEKAEIDNFIEIVFDKHCSSESKNMLRKNFHRGMTNMTMITADEEAGMALVLLIIGQMDKGYGILKSRDGYEDNTQQKDIDDNILDSYHHYYPEKNDMQHNNYDNDSMEDMEIHDSQDNDDVDPIDFLLKNSPTEHKCSFTNFIQLIEIFLSFHSWYKSTTPFPWNLDHEKSLLLSIRKMLLRLKHTFPRNEGNGWKLQKLHELLHLPIDVTNFGSPKNFDTGIMENRLIHVGKRNAKLTQKRGTKIFTEQLGNRIYEQMLFRKTCRCLKIDDNETIQNLEDIYETDTENDDIESIEGINNDNSIIKNIIKIHCTIGRTSDGYFQLAKDRPDYKIILHDDNKSNGLFSVEPLINNLTNDNIPPMIMNKIAEYLSSINATVANCYTTIIFCQNNNQQNKIIFRAHPNYQKKQWFDWAMVKFESSVSDEERAIYDRKNNVTPAYPYGMYPSKLLSFFEVNNSYKALIHSCHYKKSSEEDSVLTERWYMEYATQNENNKTAVLHVIDIESIYDSVYVIQETPGLLPILELQINDTNLVILVKRKSTWSQYFT